MKILLVEDEQNIADPILKVLKKRGYLTDYAATGEDAIEKVKVNEYDCIILDLNLPQYDGLEIAKFVRNANDITPILMLTARTQIYDKLEGFESGADDYLTKPFDFQELLARIEALIKRSSMNKSFDLRIGNLVLNPSLNKVFDEKTKVEAELSNKETHMLEYLIRNQGKVVSVEELLEHVWDTNVNIFTDTVKTHIKTLRKKLGENAKLIKTLKGKGYTIIGE